MALIQTLSEQMTVATQNTWTVACTSVVEQQNYKT